MSSSNCPFKRYLLHRFRARWRNLEGELGLWAGQRSESCRNPCRTNRTSSCPPEVPFQGWLGSDLQTRERSPRGPPRSEAAAERCAHRDSEGVQEDPPPSSGKTGVECKARWTPPSHSGKQPDHVLSPALTTPLCTQAASHTALQTSFRAFLSIYLQEEVRGREKHSGGGGAQASLAQTLTLESQTLKAGGD